jgi:RHS repeat-associated protein
VWGVTAGRLVTTLHPDNTPSNDADNPRSHVAYDALGRKRSQTDEMQRTTTFEYNAAGQLTAVVDALQQRTVYGYDSRGRKVSQTDALNRTTRWEYDDDGRVVARVLPLGQRETMAYDAIGRLSAKTDFNGARTTYRYDAADRVEEVRHADGTGVVTTYTDSGQVETQTDAAGTTHHLYDARDRLLRITHPDGVQIAYQYDAAGNRTRMTTAQQDIAYTYDPLNRLETVVQDGRTTTYAYTEVGSRRRITLPTGARTDYTYDVRNRLHTLIHYDRNGSALLHQTYTVDASGLRTQLVEYGIHIGATRTVAYAYDPLKRLVREEVSDTTRGNRVSQWTYDAVGNRQSETRTKAGVSVTTTYAYDANDRLQGEASSDGTTTSYAYDANGSLTGKQDAQGTSVYSYDGDRRLVDAITPNAGMTYRYDANGIRQSQTVNGVTTRFVVDPTAQYAQVLEERSSTGNVLYLLGDDRIARTQGGQTRYLHTDGQGSTRLLTDSTTVATDRWWYEAFGEVETSTGTSSNAFLFAGEQLDPNLGHYYLRARYMDPSNGRFTQMDVFSGYDTDPVSLHKYLYANGSPVGYSDPSGYMTLKEAGTTLNVISNIYTAGAITFNVLTGNYGAAGVMAKEIAEEVVLSKLSYLRPVAKISDEAAALLGRIWSRTVRLKLGYPRSSNVLRHNMEEILGKAPPNHQAHHIVGGAYAEGKLTTRILQQHGIDVNSLMNGCFCRRVVIGQLLVVFIVVSTTRHTRDLFLPKLNQ